MDEEVEAEEDSDGTPAPSSEGIPTVGPEPIDNAIQSDPLAILRLLPPPPPPPPPPLAAATAALEEDGSVLAPVGALPLRPPMMSSTLMSCISRRKHKYSPKAAVRMNAHPCVTHHVALRGKANVKVQRRRWMKYAVKEKSSDFLALSTTAAREAAVARPVPKRPAIAHHPEDVETAGSAQEAKGQATERDEGRDEPECGRMG